MSAEAHADLDLELDEDTPFAKPRPAEPNPIPSPVVEAAERLKQAAGENVRRFQQAAEAGMRSFRNSGDEENAEPPTAPSWDEMREKAKQLHRDGEAWARENPTAAVAIAAGAGFVLALLLRR